MPKKVKSDDSKAPFDPLASCEIGVVEKGLSTLEGIVLHHRTISGAIIWRAGLVLFVEIASIIAMLYYLQ